MGVANLFYPELHDGVLSITIVDSMRAKDTNKDGKLTAREFWEADLADGDNGELTEEEIADFAKLDVDGDGHLNIDEIRSWESGSFHTEEAMKKLFEIADKNNDMQ